jgi:CheY-like chemotaxis protein
MATQLRLLIVDDNKDVAAMMALLVSSWGHEVRVVHSGKQAFEIAESFRPRVVLLDLGLPDMHGYDVAKRLREQSRNRVMHFIAITGWSQIADQIRSNAAGITHHLMKPANKDVLREILAAYAASEESASATTV